MSQSSDVQMKKMSHGSPQHQLEAVARLLAAFSVVSAQCFLVFKGQTNPTHDKPHEVP